MSRSVKPDYESLKNPGIKRKLAPETRNISGEYRKIRIRKIGIRWVIWHPAGDIWGSTPTWAEAMTVARGLAKIWQSGAYGKDFA